MVRILVLDFDGVLVDSLPVRDEAFKYAFLQYGELIATAAKKYHMATRGVYRKKKLYDIYVNIVGITPEEDDISCAELRFRDYVGARSNDINLLPGVDLLSKLDNIVLYIVSALPASEVVQQMKRNNVEELFVDVLGGPVSKKEHLSTILEDNNCSPEEMLFVGDALNDYEQSLHVGCLFAGIVSLNTVSPFPISTDCFSDLGSVIRKYSLV